MTLVMDTSERSGYRDFEWAVKLNRFSLKLLGLWPMTEDNVPENIMYKSRPLIIILILTFGFLVPSIHSLIRIRSNIMLLIDNLQYTLPTITCAIRVVVFWWKKEAVTSLLNMVAEDWLKIKSAQERSKMIGKAQTARIIITCAYGAMMIAFIFTGILPIFGISARYLTNTSDPDKLLPFQTYYLYDVTKRPQYEFTFIVQILCMVFGVMSYTGIDNLLGLLVFHISGQFDILRNRIMHMNDYIDFRDSVRSSVIDHTRLLRAIAIIEDTFNIILLALFLYFGILFACYGFLIISVIEKGNDLSVTRFIYLVCILINTFGHMCVYCAVGEILVAQCEHIHYTVYNYKWYTLDPRNVKVLLFLMVRSSKPTYLTAGKIFPMTMSTFCSNDNTVLYAVNLTFSQNVNAMSQ
ncbi:odorant receptor 49b isoform X1 [Ooceraea biroi]|uniref:odorant receptor 49b isoform X1 n=1 Tax=Ooceraea biroi TaxID=2015173 RepID=UPI000F097BBC|nr:odorant receptor 49b isoform X1 [Ooceraea biroi]